MSKKGSGGSGSGQHKSNPPSTVSHRWLVSRVVQTTPRLIMEPIDEYEDEARAHQVARDMAQAEGKPFTISKLTYADGKLLRAEHDIAVY